MSVAGGLEKALLRGRQAGCRVVQVFTRGTSRWEVGALSQAEVIRFRETRAQTGVEPVAAHVSYLINLASPRNDVREKSLAALEDEVKRSARLEIPYLVMHPGAHLGTGTDLGLRRIAEGIGQVLRRTPAVPVMILLETTAGQGTGLGHRLEHLAVILERVGAPDRMGVCLDTCHVFAAGYDFRSRAGYEDLMAAFEKEIGLERLKVVHVNDSRREAGSRVDRHAHIGQGCIGARGFGFFMQDRLFRDTPFILETPKDKDPKGTDMDVVNMRTLRMLETNG